MNAAILLSLPLLLLQPVHTIPQKYHSFFAHLAVVLLLAIPLFSHLDAAPLATWDEMRLAMSATEMAQSGRLIVTTAGGEPETWSTKPPMMIWIQALSLKTLGYSELSIRLPAAIAAALTCLLVLRWTRRRTGSWLAGIIAAGILITTRGFVSGHAARTGDYDALLTLFLTSALLWTGNYVDDGKQRRIYFIGAALTCAVLVKGVAGLFMLPAIFIYLLLTRRLPAMLRSKATYITAAGFITIVAGYYLLREVQQPGYWKAVQENEIGGRYLKTLERHGGDEWAYYDHIVNAGFPPWHWLIIPAVLAGIATRDARCRRVAGLCGLGAGSLFLILNSGGTKLFWYVVPMYPLLAILCALPLWQLCRVLAQSVPAGRIWRVNLLPALLLFGVFALPYQAVVDLAMGTRNYDGQTDVWDAKMYLQGAIRGQRRVDSSLLLCGDTYPLEWYREVLQIKGYHVRSAHFDSLGSGMKVLAYEDPINTAIRQRYNAHATDSAGAVRVWAIEGRRTATDSMQQAL